MPRHKVEVRREEILAAAAAEVTKRGFGQTRIADVAAELGVSPALIFYHFGTKERLFAEALSYAVRQDLERLDSTVAAARNPVDAVRRIIAQYSPVGSAPGWTVWVDAWAESLREPEMRHVMSTLDRRWKQALADQIRAGVAEGTFTCADPTAAATRIAALMDGLGVQVMVHRTLSRAKLGQWAREAAARELGIPPSLLS